MDVRRRDNGEVKYKWNQYSLPRCYRRQHFESFPCLKTMKNQFIVCSVDDSTVSYRRRLLFTSRREEKGRLTLIHWRKNDYKINIKCKTLNKRLQHWKLYKTAYFNSWQMSVIYRTFKNCNKRMGLPYLFLCTCNSGCFSYLREKCSKLKQPVKNSYFIAKIINHTKTLCPFVCLGYIFQVQWTKITRSWKKVEKWTVLTFSRTCSYLNAEIHVIHI